MCACVILYGHLWFFLSRLPTLQSPLTPFAWGRNSCVRFALFCIWGPHKFSIFGESGSSSRLMTQASFIATCLLNANRLPKHFCAHWSQHLPCRCFSLFIAPEWYSGAFSRKSTFLKIYLLIYLSYTLPSSAERRAGEDRENNGTTPRQQKVLFVNICHRHWLYSARGFPREFPSVPFRSPSSLLSCSRGSAREISSPLNLKL